MKTRQIRTITGSTTELDPGMLQRFNDQLHGRLVTPDTDDYEDARKVWNGLIDKRPALIVRCAEAQDVVASVNFAREHALLFSVRGGGHNVAGNALVEDGMVIDLTPMRQVQVDPERRIARAAGGATLADLDRATQAHGLATPVGLVSRTGVAGLTLSGGFGWLTRRYGLSCDNLRSVDIVTADGRLRTASATENPDLFWAVRGGGGNFGAITAFEYDLHPVGPEVMLAVVFYAPEHALEGLNWLRDFMREAPEELMALASLWTVPEGPQFPADRAGDPALVFVAVYAGDVEEGKRVVAPLRTWQEPLADLSGPISWLEAQTFYDEDYPDGMLYYWKSSYLDEISDDANEILADAGINRPSALSNLDVWYLGGAMKLTAPDETAFWYRNVAAMIGIEANWENPEQSGANIRWAREVVDRLQPYASDGSYANFGGFPQDRDNPAPKIYGGNYERLLRIKREVDPDNLFRSGKNIDPTRRA
jgi:FAD/FMN-containing dehydrogenase